MIPPEKPDLIYLLNIDRVSYDAYNVRICHMPGNPLAPTVK
jgi:hypothetical protein